MTKRVQLAFDELLSALDEEGWNDYLMYDVRILRRKYHEEEKQR